MRNDVIVEFCLSNISGVWGFFHDIWPVDQFNLVAKVLYPCNTGPVSLPERSFVLFRELPSERRFKCGGKEIVTRKEIQGRGNEQYEVGTKWQDGAIQR